MMRKIKPREATINMRWRKTVMAVMEAHYPDGMTVDDFMSLHSRAPRPVIVKIIDTLIADKHVDEIL